MNDTETSSRPDTESLGRVSAATEAESGEEEWKEPGEIRMSTILDNSLNNGLSKGETETAIRNAVIKFEQEFMGRGPTEVKAFILRDMVVVRLKGVLTPAERQLAKNAEGVDMVKRMRQNLISQGRERLCSQISAITGVEVTGLFTDIETHSGERMIVFTLENDLDNMVR